MGITGTVPEPRRLSSFGASSNRCADECLLSGVRGYTAKQIYGGGKGDVRLDIRTAASRRPRTASNVANVVFARRGDTTPGPSFAVSAARRRTRCIQCLKLLRCQCQ